MALTPVETSLPRPGATRVRPVPGRRSAESHRRDRERSGAIAQRAVHRRGVETIQLRTMRTYTGDLTLRMTTLGEDIVTRGASMTVVSRVLGFS